MRISEPKFSFDPTTASDALALGDIPRASSLHTLAPYIGKMRPEIAKWAIEKVSIEGQTIYDPFCGSGTVLLEGWVANRQVIGTDLNPYAWLISQAKLHPYDEEPESVAQRLEEYALEVKTRVEGLSLASVDPWIKDFFHPETLLELLGWIETLSAHKDAFALACLLGIAHHQRPGFLSYPSSNLVPYLRTNKFPRESFPEMYAYREVLPRLQKKIRRACSTIPPLDYGVKREVHLCDAAGLNLQNQVDAIITSPPYMGQLDYARDNRLRLGLLGIGDLYELNRELSPRANKFSEKLDGWLESWQSLLKPNGKLALLVGDTTNTTRRRLDTLVVELVRERWSSYKLIGKFVSDIPEARRSRKNCTGSMSESLLVFQLQK